MIAMIGAGFWARFGQTDNRGDDFLLEQQQKRTAGPCPALTACA